VPNLARKELPDVSAIPTASPQAPASPNLGFYYVVTDYQNEQSLLAAQKVVPEAFVWQFPHGVKVQLAAFEVRAQAEQFVADLKAKGIDARVYP
jgi:cell division protein FtsN